MEKNREKYYEKTITVNLVDNQTTIFSSQWSLNQLRSFKALYDQWKFEPTEPVLINAEFCSKEQLKRIKKFLELKFNIEILRTSAIIEILKISDLLNCSSMYKNCLNIVTPRLSTKFQKDLEKKQSSFPFLNQALSLALGNHILENSSQLDQFLFSASYKSLHIQIPEECEPCLTGDVVSVHYQDNRVNYWHNKKIYTINRTPQGKLIQNLLSSDDDKIFNVFEMLTLRSQSSVLEVYNFCSDTLEFRTLIAKEPLKLYFSKQLNCLFALYPYSLIKYFLTKEKHCTITNFQHKIRATAFDDQQLLLYVGCKNKVSVIDLKKKEKINLLSLSRHERIQSLCLSGNSSFLCIGITLSSSSTIDKILFWNTAKKFNTRLISDFDKYLSSHLQLSPDGRLLVLASPLEKKAYLFNAKKLIEEREKIKFKKLDYQGGPINFSSDSTTLAMIKTTPKPYGDEISFMEHTVYDPDVYYHLRRLSAEHILLIQACINKFKQSGPIYPITLHGKNRKLFEELPRLLQSYLRRNIQINCAWNRRDVVQTVFYSTLFLTLLYILNQFYNLYQLDSQLKSSISHL